MFKIKANLLLITVGIGILTFLTYRWISSLPRTADLPGTNREVSVQRGENVFWGKGTCHVCHRIGEHGYARRGPNLGESADGNILPIRAEQRAQKLGLKSNLDYIVQSLAEPETFLVPGYRNEMPKPYLPPIALSPSEIKSVVLYLASLEGDSVTTEIELPNSLLAAYGKKRDDFKIEGDIEAGRRLFYDLQGPAACASCHIAIDGYGKRTGSTIGPDLSAIASFRTPEHIYWKILKPDSNVVSKHEETVIKTKGGSMIAGEVIAENATELVVRERNGSEMTLQKKIISSRRIQPGANMPSNYDELLTPEQLRDLVAYLQTLGQ